MFYHIFFPLADEFVALNVFRYLTFRTGGAVVTALAISFFLGPKIIDFLKNRQKWEQPIRSDGPESHIISKKGIPTMGGVLILFALSIATLLWAKLTNPFVWVSLGITAAFGTIGFMDDYLKVTQRNSGGLSG